MDDGKARRDPRPKKWGPATAINALGSVIDLAHSPRLLAQELVQILSEVHVKASVATGEATQRLQRTMSLWSVGTDRGEPVSLVCQMPQTPEQVVLMQDVLRVGRAAVELERYREDERRRTALWPEDPIEEQLGALFISEEMRELLATVRRIAATTVPVLITGETGTGKEVVARLVHAYSQRAKGAVPRLQLHLDAEGHARFAALRTSTGSLHRSRRTLPRHRPHRRPGHLAAGRDRRHAARRATQAAAIPGVGARFIRLASPGRRGSTFACSPQPTHGSKRWSPRANSARTSTTA